MDIKQLKKLSRLQFLGMKLKHIIFKDKKKYNRKVKHIKSVYRSDV